MEYLSSFEDSCLLNKLTFGNIVLVTLVIVLMFLIWRFFPYSDSINTGGKTLLPMSSFKVLINVLKFKVRLVKLLNILNDVIIMLLALTSFTLLQSGFLRFLLGRQLSEEFWWGKVWDLNGICWKQWCSHYQILE